MLASVNFAYLRGHDLRLATLGAQAERYFREDPSTSIIKLRQLAELLAKLIAAHHALYRGERETFEETLRRLSYERIIPKEAADVFHALRKIGNVAVHDAIGGHAEALTSLKFARQLSIWFHRTYGREPSFNPGPFNPPPEPIDATVSLKEEIARLQRQVGESAETLAAVQRRAEQESRERESLAERLNREAEEKAVWEQLAQDNEAARIEMAAKLASVQTAAEVAPKTETVEFVERGIVAATQDRPRRVRNARPRRSAAEGSRLGGRHQDASPRGRRSSGQRVAAWRSRNGRPRTVPPIMPCSSIQN